MASLLGSGIKSFLKISEVSIDNNVFKLHYKVTCVMLIACSLLVTEKQYFGDPIDCIVTGVPASLMDTYCWIHSTYTVTNISDQFPNSNFAYPGVAPPLDNYERKYHKYYQWVTIVLFFQALLFYTPRYLWKSWECRKMSNLVMKLNLPIINEQLKNARKLNLIDYYIRNLHAHNGYAIRYFLCELLNFVNVIMQIFITDWFLGGEFTTYGTRVVEFNRARFGTRFDPMDEVFPKVTKCTFYNYGPSGSVQRIDGLCILPINVLNEKIYIILWFWFIILAVISGIALLYRIATFVPVVRSKLLETKSYLASEDDVRRVASFADIGDWFVLYQLAKNIDPMVFAEIIRLLAAHSRGADEEPNRNSIYVQLLSQSLDSTDGGKDKMDGNERNSVIYPPLLRKSYEEADTLPAKRKLSKDLCVDE